MFESIFVKAILIVLNSEENARLSDLYKNKSYLDATKQLLDIILRKKSPLRKWELFLDALGKEGKKYDFSLFKSPIGFCQT